MDDLPDINSRTCKFSKPQPLKLCAHLSVPVSSLNERLEQHKALKASILLERSQVPETVNLKDIRGRSYSLFAFEEREMETGRQGEI